MSLSIPCMLQGPNDDNDDDINEGDVGGGDDDDDAIASGDYDDGSKTCQPWVLGGRRPQ